MKRAIVVGMSLFSCSFAIAARAGDLTMDPTTDVPPPPPPIPTATAPAPTTRAPVPPTDAPGAPATMTTAPPPGTTAAALETASREDSGVGLHLLYVRPFFGAGFASIGSVAPSGSSSSEGPMFGLAAGAELIAFQVGAAYSHLSTNDFTIQSLVAEAAYAPIHGRFVPRIGLAAGYAWVGTSFPSVTDVGAGTRIAPPSGIGGLDFGVRVGASYFVTSSIDIGLDLSLDALFLSYTRESQTTSAQGVVTDVTPSLATTTGMASLQAHVAWHWP